MFTGDPLKDFDRHDAEEQAWLDKLPICSCCGEPIQSEECYVFDEDKICPHCLKEYYCERTEKFYQD